MAQFTNADGTTGNTKQLAHTARTLLRSGDPSVIVPILENAGFTSFSINTDGNVYDLTAKAFLTDAQLATLLPSLPQISGSQPINPPTP